MHLTILILKKITKIEELTLLFYTVKERMQKDFSNFLESFFYFFYSVFLIYLKYKEIEYSRISSKRIISKIWH